MKFHYYDSIENSYQEKFLEQVREFNEPNITCVATEKIHGSNLSLISDGSSTVRVAKRGSFLGESALSIFNRADIIYEKYKKIMPQLFQVTKDIVRDMYNVEITSMNLFGEIFGGYYPSVKSVPSGVKPVQKGVAYTNTIEFAAFDIYVTYEKGIKKEEEEEEEEEADEERADEEEQDHSDFSLCASSFYVDFSVFCCILDTFFNMTGIQILRVPVVAEGSFEDMLNIDVNTLNSTIPMLCGLPEVENNIAEGVVIRGKEVNLLDQFHHRILLKQKSNKFSENVGNKRVNSNIKMPKSDTPEQLERNAALSKLFEDFPVDSYDCLPRFSSVASKHTKQELCIKGTYLYARDICDDYLKDVKGNYDESLIRDKDVLKFIIMNLGSKVADEYINKL